MNRGGGPVPIETTFRHLATQCQRQRDDLSELQITIAEDRPLHAVVRLVDKLSEVVEDILGHSEEALTAALEGHQSVGESIKWDRVGRALTDCQTSVCELQRRFFTDLACYEVIDEVVGLGRKRGGEWQSWATLVREMLDRCRRQTLDTQQSVCECWQEIAEHAILNTAMALPGSDSKKVVSIKKVKPG
jgi:hypothetical protein